MKANLPVTFFCPEAKELERVDDGRPVDETVEHWEVPQPIRVRSWVVQPVLRLREGGYSVEISRHLPDEGAVIVLPEPHILSAFREQFTAAHRNLIIVTIRADIVGFRSPYADAEIVQNGRFADEQRTFHITHWPQPGLLPRDPARGASIKTIAFKGDQGNLHPELFTDRLYAFLDEHGIELQLEEPRDRTLPQPWHDFEDVDLLLAVRKPWHSGDLFYNKPASKLINAWHAGVPALLGPEYAFRELRQDRLDYYEVKNDGDVIRAMSELIEHPDRYQEMVEHGRQRAQEFSVERITERWADVLFEKIPQVAQRRDVKMSRNIPLGLRRAWNMSVMPPSPHELRKQAGYVYRGVREKVVV